MNVDDKAEKLLSEFKSIADDKVKVELHVDIALKDIYMYKFSIGEFYTQLPLQKDYMEMIKDDQCHMAAEHYYPMIRTMFVSGSML